MNFKYIVVLLLSLLPSLSLSAVTASSLIEKAENQVRGKDFKSKMTLNVIRGSEGRSIELRIWTITTEMALLKILNPVKDRFGGNLRTDGALWQYLPNVERVIRIPPSLMGQAWMGSDFSNDDLVKASSWSRDYTHEIIGEENIKGVPTVKIQCTPKKNAPVVWGKLIIVLRKADAVLMRQEFYNERNELVKFMVGSEFKTSGTHTVPTKLEMFAPKKPQNKTVMQYIDFSFDSGIPKTTFTQDFLKKKILN